MLKPRPLTNAQLNLLARVRSEVTVQLDLSAEKSRELVTRLAELLIEAARSTANEPEESSDD
jgi:hypothetical protein